MKKVLWAALLVAMASACSGSKRSRTGTGGSGGTGGDGGQGDNAGTGGDGANGGSGGGTDGGGPPDKGVSFDPDAASCGQMTTPIMVDPQVPDLIIAFDRSGSMTTSFGMGTRFSVETEILTRLLTKFEGAVRFGFEQFPTNSFSCPGGASCCADAAVKIAPATGNAGKIIAALKAAPGGTAIQTPTPHALKVVRQFYEGLNDGVKNRYVLLSTDGEPNCSVDGQYSNVTESCGQAVTEVKSMLSDGVKTIALGVSDDATGACMSSIGNAGGAPAPAPNNGYYPGTDPDALEKALDDIISGIAKPSCTVTLKDMPPDMARVAVFFDDVQVPWDPTHTDGWDYDTGGTSITVYGSFCGKLQGFEVKVVDVRFGCPPCGATVSCH